MNDFLEIEFELNSEKEIVNSKIRTSEEEDYRNLVLYSTGASALIELLAKKTGNSLEKTLDLFNKIVMSEEK